MSLMIKRVFADNVTGHHLLFVPLLVYLSLSLLYLFAVPAGESPDEPGHLQCIEQVSLLGRLPEIEPKPEGDEWWSRGRIISGRMCYHMPLYYLVAGGVQKVTATAVSEPIHYEFPPTNPNFGQGTALFDHPVKPSFWTYTEPTHLLVLRLLSILLGGVTVWASYAVARRLLPGQPMVALLAGLLTAVWPQFVYLSRSLNNDSLATALSVTILVILLDVQRPQRFVWAALLAVLALFTKLSVAFTLAAVLLVWGLEFWRLPGQRREYMRTLLICLALFVGAFLLLYFTPTIWGHFRQGSGAFSSVSESAREWTYWREVLQLTASSGWVRFGWMNVAAPQGHAYAWWGFLLATAVLGIWVIGWSGVGGNGRLHLLICGIWLLFITLSYLQINLNRLQPQFRFALAAIPILTTWSAAGWWGVVKGNGRLATLTSATIIVILVFYNIWVVFSVIKLAYPWW
jgi:hypothetical protein